MGHLNFHLLRNLEFDPRISENAGKEMALHSFPSENALHNGKILSFKYIIFYFIFPNTCSSN